MVDDFVIIFYKIFKLIITIFCNSFYIKILAYLFAIVHFSIDKYQSEVKIVTLLNKKIT